MLAVCSELSHLLLHPGFDLTCSPCKVLLNIVTSASNILSVLLESSLSPMNSFSPHDLSSFNLDALSATLASVENTLKSRLCAFECKNMSGSLRVGSTGPIMDPEPEIFVPSNVAWKDRFISRLRRSKIGNRGSLDMNVNGMASESDEAMRTLVSCKIEIQQLWKSPVVQELMNRRGVRLEESPGL